MWFLLCRGYICTCILYLYLVPVLCPCASVPLQLTSSSSSSSPFSLLSYDRLLTKTVDFVAKPDQRAGAEGTIHTTGATDLHVPLDTGAWQVRVYELGQAHSIYTATGNLLDALHFTDPLNTTYEMTVHFDLPKEVPGSKNNFTATFSAVDQSHGQYFCLDVNYDIKN